MHSKILLPTAFYTQLQRAIELWIISKYHQRTHSETNRKPLELWEETVRLRMPESEEALDNLLLKDDQIRKIRNIGITFVVNGAGGTYWSPALVDLYGREVRLRYNPEDRESVLVYCAATGKFICEAWLMGQEDSRYKIDDVKRERNAFRRGLLTRLKEYAQEIDRNDRNSAPHLKREWEEARKLAEISLNGSSGKTEQDKADEAVENLLSKLKRAERANA